MYELRVDYTIELPDRNRAENAETIAGHLSEVIAEWASLWAARATGTVEVVEADDEEDS